MVAALVLIGAPGSGKSSVLEALMTLLELDGREYGALETEQLSLGSQLLPAASSAEQLDAVLALQRRAGRRLFLLVATTEDADQLRAVLSAARADVALVVCVTASADTVARRLAEREPDRWPGKAALIAHARSLAQTVPRIDGIDVKLDSEHASAEEIALAVREQMHARGLV